MDLQQKDLNGKRKNLPDKSTYKWQWQIAHFHMNTVNQSTQNIEEKGRLKILYIQENHKK